MSYIRLLTDSTRSLKTNVSGTQSTGTAYVNMKRYHFGRWKLCIVETPRFLPDWTVAEKSLVAAGRKDAADADGSPSCSREARR